MDYDDLPHDVEEEKKVSPPPVAEQHHELPHTHATPSDDSQVLRATIERLQQELLASQRREEARVRREEARLRDLRRVSIGNPLTTPGAAVSSLTDPFVGALLSSPARPNRRSQGPVRTEVADLYDDVEDDEGETSHVHPRIHEGTAEQTTRGVSSNLTAERRQTIINKALTKIPSPGRFSGKDEKEKDNCENWCKQMTNYLNGLFRGITDAHAERMQIVLGLLDQPASDWMNGVYREEENMSWEQLQPAFLEYIQGGRDRRALWKEKMEALAYGRGKCKDLLQFDHEFETLRIKLYPSSSANADMNQRSADDYGAAIRRGDPQLYIECVRLLGRDYEHARLSDWKKVAQQAVTIRNLTREMRASHDTGARGGYIYRPPQTSHQAGRTSLQHVHAEESGKEEENEVGGLPPQAEEPTAAVQGVNTARQPLSDTGSSQDEGGIRLSPEVRRRLMAQGKCFSCYRRGHRARDVNECPNKGKRATRLPTKEELNA
jgi:hypothetical protein